MVLVAARSPAERPDQVACATTRWRSAGHRSTTSSTASSTGSASSTSGPTAVSQCLAENSVETVLAHLGGLLAGASTVPVNFHLNADEVAYILGDSGARVLFVGPGTAATGLAAARQVGVPVVIGWRHVARWVDGSRSWEAWLAAASPAEPSPTSSRDPT